LNISFAINDIPASFLFFEVCQVFLLPIPSALLSQRAQPGSLYLSHRLTRSPFLNPELCFTPRTGDACRMRERKTCFEWEPR
jgi:hypothetical protein